MRDVSAKALSVKRMSMFLRCKRNNYRHENTQGVATLYPGLCAFALLRLQRVLVAMFGMGRTLNVLICL